MYELIFTVIVMVNGKFGFNQTMLHSFSNLDHCVMTRELLKTAKESGTVPGILECRKTT